MTMFSDLFSTENWLLIVFLINILENTIIKKDSVSYCDKTKAQNLLIFAQTMTKMKIVAD